MSNSKTACTSRKEPTSPSRLITTTLLTNQWGLERDKEVHKDPEAFRPERWIENPDLPLAAFGFGRRKCPGNKFP